MPVGDMLDMLGFSWPHCTERIGVISPKPCGHCERQSEFARPYLAGFLLVRTAPYVLGPQHIINRSDHLAVHLQELLASEEGNGGFRACLHTVGQETCVVVADPDRTVSKLYDMVHPEADPSITVRSVFIIDANKKVRLILTYPPSTGRNFQEILRVIDSLQLTDAHKVATPVNWKDGDDVIIVPSLSDADAKTRFPDGWKTLKPYLRVVKQPALAR